MKPKVIEDPERWIFIEEFSAKYFERHPDRGKRYARRQARLRWRTRQKQLINKG